MEEMTFEQFERAMFAGIAEAQATDRLVRIDFAIEAVQPREPATDDDNDDFGGSFPLSVEYDDDGFEPSDIDWGLVIEILNRRDGGVGIYVGRAGRGVKASPLGNPFKMDGEADRDRVVAEYRRWLWEQVEAGEGAAWEELQRLAERVRAGEKLNLVCWCSPKRCHAEIIRDCLEWMVRTGTGV